MKGINGIKDEKEASHKRRKERLLFVMKVANLGVIIDKQFSSQLAELSRYGEGGFPAQIR